MLSALRRRQTLASFDYQWRALAEGDAMLSDPWFVDNVDRIVSEELLAVRRSWFDGRRVLDAGCGGGRWTVGLLRLGARVTAVDYSAHSLAATRAQAARLSRPRWTTAGWRRARPISRSAGRSRRSLTISSSPSACSTTPADTRRALGVLADRVARDGLLFVYLYGSRSVSWGKRMALAAGRAALAPLPFAAKQRVLARLLPGRDTHQAFDLSLPVINERYDRATVEGWLRDLGFSDVTPTLAHTELFLRAHRGHCSAQPFAPPASPPYWFERYRR
jgi:SAM-dependent methyltransferase